MLYIFKVVIKKNNPTFSIDDSQDLEISGALAMDC